MVRLLIVVLVALLTIQPAFSQDAGLRTVIDDTSAQGVLGFAIEQMFEAERLDDVSFTMYREGKRERSFRALVEGGEEPNITLLYTAWSGKRPSSKMMVEYNETHPGSNVVMRKAVPSVVAYLDLTHGVTRGALAKFLTDFESDMDDADALLK